jgi:predicted TIM-barrel fold metal-dependent hydrolase
MVDVDSHLMLFPGTMAEILGTDSTGRPWHGRGALASVIDELTRMIADEGLDPSGEGESFVQRRQEAKADVWGIRSWASHGAQIAMDRLDALDKMGIRRQLVFSQFMEAPLHTTDPAASGAIARYNDYVIDWAKGVQDRVVPVCVLNMSNREAALAEAGRVLERGARAVQIPANLPPAGSSPAAAEWDPLWAMLSEAGAPALIHSGGTAGMPSLVHSSWPELSWSALKPPPADPAADDFHARPFIWTIMHLPAEVTLTFMVLGGVFERHPNLRFGVIECGAGWVAAWCQRMDTLANSVSSYLKRVLSLMPSDYVRRQIRVAPLVFEPVGSWIERSGLDEVYAFSTDYPHAEGGVDSVDRFYASLAPLGDAVVEKFFVTNGGDLF